MVFSTNFIEHSIKMNTSCIISTWIKLISKKRKFDALVKLIKQNDLAEDKVLKLFEVKLVKKKGNTHLKKKSEDSTQNSLLLAQAQGV